MLLPRRSVGLALSGIAALGGVVVDGLAVGSDHTCVLLDDGSVKCFGLNDFGQLGLGDKDDRGGSGSTMGDDLAAVDFGVGAPAVVALSAGEGHTCVIFEGGSLKCFGKNNKGQLGQGNKSNLGDEALEMGDNLDPVFLGTGRTAVAVAAEGDRTCALLDSGDVRCWGDAEHGALGTGDLKNTGDGKVDVADAVDLGDIGVVTSIGSGPCVITEDGVMKCWGKGYYGKNGQGTADNAGDQPGEMGDALPAVPLGGRSLARSMAGGRDFVCALLDGGSLKCWGRAEGGQLGSEAVLTVGDDPDEMGDSLPTVDLGPGESVVQVAAGIQHTCALLLSGAVKCWGRNFFGNLGLEDFRARGHAPETMGGSLPEVDLGTGRTAVSIAAGGERACAILDDGSLKCWGDNSRGQLGLGDKEARGRTVPEMGDSLPAVDLGTGRTVVALASTALPAGAPPAPVSTVAPTPVATVSPSPKPTPVPTTASLAPTPIPLVPAPSTPVPASPTTSPSVPPPAPTTSPSVPGAPTTSPLGPVAPTTSPSSPPAPTEASRSIPAPLTSSPAGATPSPAGATLSPAGATPSPAGATPSPAGATPSPVGATPGPVLGATPSPMGATPSPVGTTTSPAAGIPPTTTPSPSVAGGPEGPGGPEGATEGGGTGAPEVTMEPSVPLSPSSSSSAARDGGSNTSLAPVEGVGVDVTIPETDVGSEQGGSSGDDSNSTTIVASIAAPVGILSLLVIACFLRRSRGGAAPVAAKPDDMLSPHGSMHGSVFGEENAVGQSTQSAVV